MNSEQVIPAIIFGAIVAVVKIISDTMTRHRLIAKGIIDEKVQHLFARDAQMQWLSSLKWGMVLVGIGLALLIGQLAEEYFSDESIVGLIFIFAGVAFLIYYGIAKQRLQGQADRL
ncbi:MAG TPA: DUF6249 domain-containing protein [Candidatus Deferrimicrobium sp.]|nr:DUF6249 domain-containing protein [Candidatus Deferrimicrobium sp.]